MLTIKQTAETGILPEQLIRKLVRKKLIPGFYSGNRFLVNISALRELLNTPEGMARLSSRPGGAKESNDAEEKTNGSKSKKCKTCAHHDACVAMLKRLGIDTKTCQANMRDGCEFYVERSKIVELPCEIGAPVWWCVYPEDTDPGEEPGPRQDFSVEELVWNGSSWGVLIEECVEPIGSKYAFLSKEEAEQHLEQHLAEENINSTRK